MANSEADITKAVRAALKVVDHPANTVKPIKALQKEFFLCTATGKLRILMKSELDDKSELASPNFYTTDDAVVLMRRLLEELAFPIEEKEFKYIYSDFFASPSTKLIKHFAFDPTPQGKDTHNFWVEPLIEGKQGDWRAIENWLYELVCNQDQTAYDYLLRWIAHAIQKPHEKPEVMIVLMGKEGTGKGTLFKILRLIFGKVVYPVDKPDQMVGKFNGVLNNKYIVWSDEAIFVGAHEQQNSLKSIITEDYITTELKHQTQKPIRSYHRFIAATNKDHFSRISPEDRRFAFYRVSNYRLGDKHYWVAFWKAIKDSGALDAFVYHLRNLDLTEFNPRHKPITNELIRQKELSLSGVTRFLREVLTEANWVLSRSNTQPVEGVPYIDAPRITTIDFLEYYKIYDLTAGKREGLQQRQIKEKVKEALPSVQFKRIGNLQAIQFPTLDVAREEFQRHLTHDIPEWNIPTETNGEIFK